MAELKIRLRVNQRENRIAASRNITAEFERRVPGNYGECNQNAIPVPE